VTGAIEFDSEIILKLETTKRQARITYREFFNIRILYILHTTTTVSTKH